MVLDFKIKEQHVSSKKGWIETMNMIARKCYQFHDFSVFATNIPLKELPLELKDFEEKQLESFTSAKKAISNQFREYLIGEIQDILKNDYNFYSVIVIFLVFLNFVIRLGKSNTLIWSSKNYS